MNIMQLRNPMDLIRPKPKVKPTKAELANDIDLLLIDCKCGADGHTFKIKLNGYVYIITRSVEETRR
jgi:hypothetical protein